MFQHFPEYLISIQLDDSGTSIIKPFLNIRVSSKSFSNREISETERAINSGGGYTSIKGVTEGKILRDERRGRNVRRKKSPSRTERIFEDTLALAFL